MSKIILAEASMSLVAVSCSASSWFKRKISERLMTLCSCFEYVSIHRFIVSVTIYSLDLISLETASCKDGILHIEMKKNVEVPPLEKAIKNLKIPILPI